MLPTKVPILQHLARRRIKSLNVHMTLRYVTRPRAVLPSHVLVAQLVGTHANRIWANLLAGERSSLCPTRTASPPRLRPVESEATSRLSGAVVTFTRAQNSPDEPSSHSHLGTTSTGRKAADHSVQASGRALQRRAAAVARLTHSAADSRPEIRGPSEEALVSKLARVDKAI
jgi:hypothetical protein